MKILVTGSAGFIGFHVSKGLLEKGHTVVGLDNINNYYHNSLKYARLIELGISKIHAQVFDKLTPSDKYDNFNFVRLNLEDKEELKNLFHKEQFQVVCNLAAQAGVRYSLENPQTYIDSNIIGFFNILENCRYFGVNHLVYASSSSVYGKNTKVPFEVTDPVDHPVSLYAATKKSNELMAHTYSHLHGLATTGLRFFTVYGPWGRPDMAMFLFTEAIIKGRPIKVFNHGNLKRDFTYIDDITEGVVRVLEKEVSSSLKNDIPYKLYNIGNGQSVKIMDFISAIEYTLGLEAVKEMLPMEPGDVEKTWANMDALKRDFNYAPNTPIKKGIKAFIDWYRSYYQN